MIITSLVSLRALVRTAIVSGVILTGWVSASAQVSTNYLYSHLAGPTGTSTSGDGTGAGAKFLRPHAIATDRSGTIYVVDSGSGTIRKISSGGVVTTFAGTAGATGNADGTGSAARFSNPSAIAVNAFGDLYVADEDNNSIRKITSTGAVTTVAGSTTAGTADGLGSAARFHRPSGIAVDQQGNIYVADTLNHTIRKISSVGAVTTLAGSAGVEGSMDGAGSSARFSRPTGLTLNNAGDVYVADSGNNTIRRITAAGLVSTIAGTAGQSGNADGSGATARFSQPTGIVVDANGILFVTDGGAAIRRISVTGVVTTFAGTAGVYGSANGTGVAARFSGINGIAIDGTTIYVADTNNDSIRTLTSTGVSSTFAGSPPPASVDATGASARFNLPSSVAVDSAGTVYVADPFNHTIRKITSNGVVSTLAGMAATPGSTDASGVNARFSSPSALAVDRAGILYVADTGNNTIRRVSPSGNVTTFAGVAGEHGSTNGVGPAARFDRPSSIAVDGSGNLYVTDELNHTVRKITSSANVTTLAGTAGLSGSQDGLGSAARFNHPEAVAVDTAGTVYVADRNNVIRKITSSGSVSTFAGTAGSRGSTDGTGSSARFDRPSGLSVDASGNVIVADRENNTIRLITSAGVVSTIGGVAGQIGSTDGATGTATFNHPEGVAVDSAGTIYVADTNNNSIRKGVTLAPSLPTITAQPMSQAAVIGGRAVFTVTATDAVSYQWTKNGTAIPGATSATLVLTNVQLSDIGDYRVDITSAAGTVQSVAAALTAVPQSGTRLVNISTRSFVGTGSDVMIAGFIIGGTDTKTVLIRASGPALSQFNLTGLLADPVLELHQNKTILAQNDNWGDDATAKAALTHAFLLSNAFSWSDGSKDAAIIATLTPGAYSAVVAGQGSTTGLALVEAYELDLANGGAKLINLSTRSAVRMDSNVQIAGFIIGGSTAKKVLIRASGPALTKYGVVGALADPVLELHNATDTIATNDNWSASNRADFLAAGVDNWELGSKDAALVATLAPGAYTAIVSGQGNTIGVALLELLELE